VLRLAGRPSAGRLSARDAAFARRLRLEVLTWRARLDRSLAPLTDRPLDRLEGVVLAALRVGAAQLLLLDTPPHAAVSETVAAAPRRARGLVNAVLRRLAREGEPGGEADPAVFYSHPPDLVERWTRRWGPQRTERLLRWNNSIPPTGCYVLDGSRPGSAGRYLEDYRNLDGEIPAAGLAAFLSGHRAYVQDEAAALVGRGVRSLASGGRILELGAAPGGKTVHLAGAGTVLSADGSRERMSVWRSNVRRLDLPGCHGVVARGDSLPLLGGFDTVLVDAPCTGTGVYRRRRDAKYGWSTGLLESCVRTQTALLEAAAPLLAPGGVLVYSTCSLEPEENAGASEGLMARHPRLRQVPFPAPDELVSGGALSIFPPEHGVDGLYAAAWKRVR
jgi:16S rRNA (cytosine967-C5)-methyltransferase